MCITWIVGLNDMSNFDIHFTLLKNNRERNEDTLSHSTKKFKESYQNTGDKNENHMARMGSYRDKLVGSIPGAFEKLLVLIVLCRKTLNLIKKMRIVRMRI